jgi:peptidoglycan-N-acetylglucosamine deacetylase
MTGPAPSVAAAAGLAALAAWSAPAGAPHVPPLCRWLRIGRRATLHRAVGLTFDDGPHPLATPAVLEILARHDATATFFVVGEQVRRTGSLLSEIVAAGHQIAVHGDTHRNLLRLSPRALAADLDRAVDTLGAPPASGLHRAPYGVYSLAALADVRRRGWTPLLWSRWGRDWRARATADSVTADVTRDLTAGDVLLLHDADDYSAPGSWHAMVGALPRVLDRIMGAGLRARAVTAAQVPGSGR